MTEKHSTENWKVRKSKH